MVKSSHGLEHHGLVHVGRQHWNLSTAALYEEIILRREGHVAHGGPVVVRTGVHTGRAPKDKFVVCEPAMRDRIWWGSVNREFPAERFDALFRRLTAYLQGRDLFVQDCYAGADPEYRYKIRIVTELAWHSLFARTMFLRPEPAELADFVPDYVIVCAPNFRADPASDGTRSETFIIPNLARRMVTIGGTFYGGEIKKSVFTLLNYLLPQRGIMPMHCSANVGPAGDVALFFGLSGTGKTTLSADPNRRLIGDDEHGWSDRGIFNFEGGCYAKTIRLSAESEPEIFATTRRFGTVLENVAIDMETRRIDLDDDSLTENTRGAYRLTEIPNAVLSGLGGHPKNIVFLTCDAFGIMPPIARLDVTQAMYHFLSGYTAKVAGTERGIVEPQVTFSTCFGAPFMVLFPSEYARLLKERVQKHGADCWLVNTGWSGGPYGVGKRMAIRYTRALVNAALEGKLRDVPTTMDPVFGVRIPDAVEGIPREVLRPRETWSDPSAYDAKARELAGLFAENFKQFTDATARDAAAGGPRL